MQLSLPASAHAVDFVVELRRVVVVDEVCQLVFYDVFYQINREEQQIAAQGDTTQRRAGAESACSRPYGPAARMDVYAVGHRGGKIKERLAGKLLSHFGRVAGDGSLE